MHRVDPEADGCAACPECGAAWHRDRWTMENQDVTARADIDKLPTHDFELGYKLICDDRGVPIAMQTFSLGSWTRSSAVDPESRDRVLAEARITRARHIRWALAVAVPTWIALMIWVSLVRPPPYADYWRTLTLIGVVTALIIALLAYFVSRTEVPAAAARALILRHGACPSCGARLPILNQRDEPPTFDGATPCRNCGRAWKLNARAGARSPVAG
ncbi:MAG: hypothetical protein SFZ23_02750 [Planctomycetota bacterium]|nr:hypothetical protein [Planctomycetota bacterium]